MKKIILPFTFLILIPFIVNSSAFTGKISPKKIVNWFEELSYGDDYSGVILLKKNMNYKKDNREFQYFRNRLTPEDLFRIRGVIFKCVNFMSGRKDGIKLDDELRNLNTLKNLKLLSITHCSKFSGKGFSYITNMGSITSIGLLDTGITDFGIKSLSQLDNITSISIYQDHQLTDKCFDYFLQFKNLEELYFGFYDNSFSKEEVLKLGQLISLRELNLGFNIRLNCKDVKKLLSNLINLEVLFLDGHKFDDESLKVLLKLKNLKKLSINAERLTSQGILKLVELKDLKFLQLENSNIETEAIEKLKKLRPKLEILNKS